MRTLYRAARVHQPTGTPGHPPATALIVDDTTIRWIGPAPDVPGPVDRTIDLGDALITPGFVDAHLHITETGLLLRGLDLRATRSVTEILHQVADAARHDTHLILGHGWDDTLLAEGRPPTRAELDRAAPGHPVYLSRIDVHSAIVSTALADTCDAPALDGWSPDGRVERDAHHAVRAATRHHLTGPQRRAVQRDALAHAAARGVVAVHEMSTPQLVPDDDPRHLLAVVAEAAAGDPVPAGPLAGTGQGLPAVTIYHATLVQTPRQARDVADRLGVPLAGLAGDLCADGSVGSRTAAFTDPYTDAPGHHGHRYLSTDQIRDHVAACTRAGLQAGFHAIGDAAVHTVRRGLRRAAEQVGVAAVRAARHRIEHAEAIDTVGIADLADLGITASVQPSFDARWGGPAGLYATRLGVARALAMNPLADLAAAGVPLALGSDSPVTPVDPWGTLQACLFHHVPTQRLGIRTALAAHTTGGWHLIGADDAGHLRTGAPATFTAWWVPGDTDPDGLPTLRPGTPRPECVLTVAGGRVLHSRL